MMRVSILSLFLAFALIDGFSQTCKDLPDRYSSYHDANQKIKSSTWLFSDSRPTPESSWIIRISYFSCDGETGFLLVRAGRLEYIHSNFPKSMWNEFRAAPSKGTYYNARIRGRYQFTP